MSLLLEALKKAEKAKEEAQRRASGELTPAESAPSSPAAALAAPAPAPASGPSANVLTRDKLPDISTPLEIVTDDLPGAQTVAEPTLEPLGPAAKRPEAPAAGQAPARRGAPRADDAGRATAKKVFEAKFREPNPRMPFYITVGVLGLFAVGTVVYFWYQLRPPPALVNANPPRPAETAVAATEVRPSPVAPVAAAAAREPAIPGLPGSPEPPARASAPAALPATPAVPAAGPARPFARAPSEPLEAAAPREEPRRLAPAEPKLAAAGPLERQPIVSRAVAQVNPRVESGYAAYVAGDMTKARADYEEALRDEPGNRDALLGIAALDVRGGRYEAAEALYLRALQINPRDAEAEAALLALRAGRSDPLATESRVKTLLAADPGAHALNFTLGNQFAQQDRWAEAQREYLKAYVAEPDNADFAYNVAVSFDHLHQGSQALDYYRRAITLAERRGASFDLAAARARAAQLGR
jgi:tetratricopeptide (TPR) repeat protein